MRDIKGIYKKFKGMNPGSIILQGKSESESLETVEEILNEKEGNQNENDKNNEILNTIFNEMIYDLENFKSF